jgi:hypothetical protein
METAVVTLSIACVVLGCSTALLGAFVPFLFWRLFKAEAKIETLDETLTDFMAQLAGQAEGEK